MTSSVSDAARSPLENVWRQFIPQGHDQALRNAFYNVAAAIFVGGAVAAAWSVYLILQPFVQALMWAVLCGSVLHPMKYKLATSVKKWLLDVQETKSLLSLSVAILPVTCLDTMSEFIGWYVMNHVKAVITVTVVLPIFYIIIHHTPSALTQFAYSIISFNYNCIKIFLDVVAYLHYVIILMVLIYVAFVMFRWTPERQIWYRRLSLPIWVLATAVVSCWWPRFNVPLFFIFTFLLLGGVFIEVTDKHSKSKGTRASILTSIVEVCSGESTKHEEISESVVEEVHKYIGSETLIQEDDQKSSTANNDITEKAEDNVDQPHLQVPRPQNLSTGTNVQNVNPTEVPKEKEKKESSELNSNMYLKGVFVACILVELWRHSILLSLLPLSMGYYCIKKATSYHIFGEGYFRGKVNDAQETVFKNVHAWVDNRRKVLFPLPLRGVFKLLKRSDKKIVTTLVDSVDVFVTIFLMLAVLIFFIFATIYLAVQIQGEGMQLISMGSQVINATIVNNPQFHELLPDGIGNFMESALDNGYVYGREWISNMIGLSYDGENSHPTLNATKVVRGVLGETNEDKAAVLEKQIIQLWDRIYQAWVVPQPLPPFSGPAVAITFDSIMEGFSQTPGLISFTTLSDVVRDNLGTVMSVMEGIWTILIGNIGLALSALTAASSVLLGGSLSILNALLNLVVFLSSLFYILSISDAVYKPVGIISGLAPLQMNSLGTAVEESVNGVFKASFKMGAFYGMWTWLLHSLFDTNIVYIPAVLGALFGAVPLVGTYWAAVPGALELFWGHGSPLMALMLIVAQLLPMSCVDTAFYAEITGGGHPYLTGLAVAGGIFCWGVEGAILGPLLLCIFLVITKMYTSLIQMPSDYSQKFKKFRRCQSDYFG